MDIKSFAIGMLLGSEDSGGGQPTTSHWTKLAEQDFTVSTTSTTATEIGTISVPGLDTIKNGGLKYIYVFVRDKAGKRNGYYYGNDYMVLYRSSGGQAVYYKSDGSVDYAGAQYGIYPSGVSDTVRISSKYASNFGALDGTFRVEVWVLDYPAGVTSLFT